MPAKCYLNPLPLLLLLLGVWILLSKEDKESRMSFLHRVQLPSGFVGIRDPGPGQLLL